MSRIRTIAIELAVPVAALVLWIVLIDDGDSFYFPSFSEVSRAFQDTWFSGGIERNLLPSLQRFAIGLVISCALGMLLGVIIGLSPMLRIATDPIVDFMRSLPPPALLPVGILLLGIGDAQKLFVIVIGTVWVIVIATVDGVRGVDQGVLEVSAVYRLSRSRRLLYVVLPAAAPQIFAGMRLAVAGALILTVVSEMIASTNGIGFFTLYSQQTFAIPEMWTGILLLGVTGYVVNLGFSAIESKILNWHRGWREFTRDQ